MVLVSSSKPLNDAVFIEAAVRSLRQAAATDKRRMQAYADSATLAAEQVQDKRLELLEQGPEVRLNEVVMSFCWMFLLEAPLVGKLVSTFTRKVLLPRAQMSLAARTYALRTMALPNVRERILVRTLLDPSSHLFSSSVDRLRGEIRSLNRYYSLLSNQESITNYSVAIAKAWAQSATTNVPRALPVTDTPGVALRGEVAVWLGDAIYSIEVETAQMEEALRSGILEPDMSALACRDGLTDVTLAEGRDRWKRQFELLIWVLLILEQQRATKKGMTNIVATTSAQVFAGLGQHIPAGLLSYFLLRFLDPTTERPFSETAAIYDANGREYEDATRALGRHMLLVSKRISREGLASLVSSNADVRGFIPRS